MLPAVPMPFLTELHLVVAWKGEEVPCLLLAKFPTETPKLERLSVYGLELQHIEDMPCFAPNSALRYISVCRIELDKVTPIINAVSTDVAVELRDIYYSWGEPITCSSHTLSISTTSDWKPSPIFAPLGTIFERLTLASSVKTLEFCCGTFMDPDTFPCVTFKGVLSRSFSTEITNFTLRFPIMRDIHLLNLLAALPSLTHLTIEEYAPEARLRVFPPRILLSEAFFDVLADSEHYNNHETSWVEHSILFDRIDDRKPLLPNLTHLVLIFRVSSITENKVKMIESRVRPASESEEIARLQSVCLHYYEDHLLDRTSRLALERLGKTEGLKLDVRKFKKSRFGR